MNYKSNHTNREKISELYTKELLYTVKYLL
jgi:hypothetical protein